MIGHTTPNGVDVFTGQQLAEVVVDITALELLFTDSPCIKFVNTLLAQQSPITPTVGNGHNLVIGQRSHGLPRTDPAIAHTQHANHDPLAGGDLVVQPQSRSWNNPRGDGGRQRAGDKLPPRKEGDFPRS